MIKVKFDKSRTVNDPNDISVEIPIEIDVKRSTDSRVRTGLDKNHQYLEDAYVIFDGSCEYVDVKFTRPDGLQCLMHMDSYDAVDIYSQLMNDTKEIGLDLDERFKLL